MLEEVHLVPTVSWGGSSLEMAIGTRPLRGAPGLSRKCEATGPFRWKSHNCDFPHEGDSLRATSIRQKPAAIPEASTAARWKAKSTCASLIDAANNQSRSVNPLNRADVNAHGVPVKMDPTR